MDTKRIRGTESEGFKRLHVASDLLDGLKETFRERAGMVKNGRRDLATAFTLVNKVFMAMLETVPIEQLVTMQRNIASASYAVGVRRPGTTNDKEYGMWVSWETINQLLEAARDRCLTCDLDTQGQRQCALAKALDTLPTEKDEGASGCGWFGRL